MFKKRKEMNDKIFTKKNARWIKLFEKFDPEGTGQIATEDFLLAIDSKDFRQDPRVARKRATLKSKVLEYGTSFITIEEFIEVINKKRNFNEIFNELLPTKLTSEKQQQITMNIIDNNQNQNYYYYYYNNNNNNPRCLNLQHQHVNMSTSNQNNNTETTTTTTTSLINEPNYNNNNNNNSNSQYYYYYHYPMVMSSPFSSITIPSSSDSSHSSSTSSISSLELNNYLSKTTLSSSAPPTNKKLFFNKMKLMIGRNFLPWDKRDQKYFYDMYKCCQPPPIFILTITLIELLFFTYYSIINNQNIPTDSLFIYRPDRKQEIWRFFLYMVLHANWLHLLFNLIIQLLIGLPLEMIHGSVRIGIIYMSGILAGSLATSIFDPNCLLIGSSGGVYALLAAHFSNVLLNYNHLDMGLLRIVGIFLIASVDISIAIYNRYIIKYFDINQQQQQQSTSSTSYVSHLAGALAGLTIGLIVLKNFEQKLHEQLLWWLAVGVYTAFHFYF